MSDQTTPPPGQPPAIDIARLAEKVYRLMLADLRLTQARRGQPAKQKKG